MSSFFSVSNCSAFGDSWHPFIERPNEGIDAGLRFVTPVHEASRLKGKEEEEQIKYVWKRERKEKWKERRRDYLIYQLKIQYRKVEFSSEFLKSTHVYAV